MKTLNEALEILKESIIRDPYSGRPLETEAYKKYRSLMREIKSSKEVEKFLIEIIRQTKADIASSTTTAFIGGIVVGIEINELPNVATDIKPEPTNSMPN